MGAAVAEPLADHLHAGVPLQQGIAQATATWMGWRIGRRTSRETGISAGLPYLTGRVLDAGIAAEAAAA